jgi:uncharacterized phage infection (PIP) family protein YhgE
MEGGTSIISQITGHAYFPWVILILIIIGGIFIKMTMHPDNKEYKHKGD